MSARVNALHKRLAALRAKVDGKVANLQKFLHQVQSRHPFVQKPGAEYAHQILPIKVRELGHLPAHTTAEHLPLPRVPRPPVTS